MQAVQIRALRLQHQGLSQPTQPSPEAALRHLVAAQAQDYPGALWSLGLRTAGATRATVEAAFNAGRVLRTHVLRPTWHFVLPEDLRMLLRLTAGRVHTVNGSMYRQEGLDVQTLVQAADVMQGALEGGQHLTREELAAALEQAGLAAKRFRLAYMVMHAELEMAICSGPRRGKQFTYALFDERVPAEAHPPGREEELARLAARYFTARGPATVQDFANWSSLTLGEARRGLEGAKDGLVAGLVDGAEHWWAPEEASASPAQRAWLLPAYDEYISGYKDRSAAMLRGDAAGVFDNAFQHALVIDGLILGSWRRVLDDKQVSAHIRPVRPLNAQERQLLNAAAEDYAQFLGIPVEWEFKED
ncbi:MAG: AlkZ family DNA glycosylase [Anaerolineales bacterium]|nr:AlkZ family DNA glycosylase [Anaerolineales bacterium]